MSPVYFDNAATTPIRPEVIEVMTSVMKNNYGNASSSHSFGRSSKSLIEKYRKEDADIVALDENLEKNNVAIEVTDLIENIEQKRVLWEKQDLIRHDPEKLADSICRVYAQ